MTNASAPVPSPPPTVTPNLGRLPVGLVGIGNMGFGMAARLLAQGWPVQVCDIDPQRCADAQALGAVVHSHPQALVAALPVGSLLVVAVVNADQCRDVMWGPHGAAWALGPGHTVMWCPTLGPADVETMAQRLAERGVDSLDAPMSGGPARALAGTMSLMVAGAASVMQRHQAVLNTLAQPVFDLGERLGDGARTKLVNNLLAGINLVGAAEAMALAAQLELDLPRTLDVIERSSGQSWIGSDRMRRALAHDLAPRAHMTLLAKDTGLAQQAASAAGFEGPLGARVAAVFRAACEGGLSELDDGALLMFLQQMGQRR